MPRAEEQMVEAEGRRADVLLLLIVRRSRGRDEEKKSSSSVPEHTRRFFSPTKVLLIFRYRRILS